MVLREGLEPPVFVCRLTRSVLSPLSHRSLNFTPSPLGILPLPLVTEAGGIGSGSFFLRNSCINLVEIMANLTGLEPATSAVTVRCSHQLNYRSVLVWAEEVPICNSPLRHFKHTNSNAPNYTRLTGSSPCSLFN